MVWTVRGAVSCLESGSNKSAVGKWLQEDRNACGKGTCTREGTDINLAWLRHCKQQEEAGDSGPCPRCTERTPVHLELAPSKTIFLDKVKVCIR